MYFISRLFHPNIWQARKDAIETQRYPPILTKCTLCGPFNEAEVIGLREEYRVKHALPRSQDVDEYPYRVTTEGGFGTGRAPFLKGIDASENRSEGARFGNFLESVQEGCKFRVVLIF